VGTITERCEQLGDFPEMGLARPEIAPDVRALVTERWLVLYRILAAGVQIVRIVDGARDLSIIELPENREP
jgi:toxin ParE1/3/4